MCNDIIPLIKDARQYRFLKALIAAHPEGLGVRPLETLVGCNHSPAEKRKLVKQGWAVMRRIITVKDRDGKTTNPSLYYLPDDDWKEKAKRACEDWAAKAEGAATPPTTQELAKEPTGTL